MNKIELRGVIVPSEYDQDWLKEYIDKGLFIPESHFRSTLSEAATDETLTVHVNSPGGSVFAAYEMVNAVLDWKRSTGQDVVVEIGAMAASAASSFAVMCADSIGCYGNSKMMFHGATTMTWAGKQAHEDVADILGKINDDVKAILVSNYGMDQSEVDEWFAEGREGWLTSTELSEAGVVDYLVGVESKAVEFTAEDIDNVQGRGLQIAALLELKEKPMQKADAIEIEQEAEAPVEEEAAEETLEVEDVGGANEPEADETDVEQVEEPPSLEQAQADNDYILKCSEAWDEGFEAGKREGSSEANEQLMSAYNELKTQCEGLNTALELACGDVENLTKDRDLLAERVGRMTAGFLAPITDEEGPDSYTAAIAECGGGTEGYLQAIKKYPKLFSK
jgi:ATP-dependent protease ClpP protease subunit